MVFGALNNEIIGSHTEQEWLDLLEKWNWRCFYCAEPVQRNSPDPNHEATKDHMTPISRDGVDFIGNIVPACRHCNDLKGNKTVEEFRAERTWVLSKKSTEDIRCGARPSDPQLIQDSPSVEVSAQAPPLPTIEVAAMWKRVIDDVAQRKTMDSTQDFAQRERRRLVLKAQAESIKRTRLEAAGQMTLPIFGDGIGRKLMETEGPALLIEKGLHIVNQLRRQQA